MTDSGCRGNSNSIIHQKHPAEMSIEKGDSGFFEGVDENHTADASFEFVLPRSMKNQPELDTKEMYD